MNFNCCNYIYLILQQFNNNRDNTGIYIVSEKLKDSSKEIFVVKINTTL